MIIKSERLAEKVVRLANGLLSTEFPADSKKNREREKFKSRRLKKHQTKMVMIAG